ncbi:hypothetical protein V2J09_015371 [Rumex salicifolius]
MGYQDIQNEDASLVLSSDAKPRLKWTPELHQRFVDAVNQVGGAEKATPKSLMRVMGIPGLTLYHLKSHLQKYRLGKNLASETCSESSNQQDDRDNPGELDLFKEEKRNPSFIPIKKSLQITRAIQMQMEVQKKLHEQIEVQRHLQLRIEAQGKYLQKVLKKAQETISGYTSSSLSSMGVEHVKAELSQLVSMVSSGCLSSSLSELTEIRAASLEELDRQIKGPGCSLESSLTSSETSDLKEPKIQEDECVYRSRQTPVALPLLDQVLGGSKRENTISEGCSCERTASKRLRVNEERVFETFDLNSQCQGPDHASIDLNSTEIDQINGVSLAL